MVTWLAAFISDMLYPHCTASAAAVPAPCPIAMHVAIVRADPNPGPSALRQRLLPAGGFKAKFHVGDTPMDVLAADGGGATAVGVLTGIYTRAELEKTGVGGSPTALVITLTCQLSSTWTILSENCVLHARP